MCTRTQVWALDDGEENLNSIRSFLQLDGWFFKNNGKEYGIELKTYTIKDKIKEHFCNIRDSKELPALIFLDANLGGDHYADKYGGFDVWRAMMDVRDEKSNDLAPDAFPDVIIYTRDPEILELTRALSHPSANPKVLPFGGNAGRSLTAKEAQYGFSPYLDCALTRRFRWLLDFSISEGNGGADTLTEQIDKENPSTITVESVRLDSLLPREFKAFLEQTDVMKEQATAKLKARILSGSRSFRQCLAEFVSFFRLGLPGYCLKLAPGSADLQKNLRKEHERGGISSFVFDSKIKDGKPSHWVNEPNCGGDPGNLGLARLLVQEAHFKWGVVLGEAAVHRAEEPFSKSAYWQKFKALYDASVRNGVTWESWKEFVTLTRDIFGDKFKEHSAIACAIHGKIKFRHPLLSVFPPDLKVIDTVLLNSSVDGSFQDGITAENIKERIEADNRDCWFCGQTKNGIHVLCDLGSPKEDGRFDVKKAKQALGHSPVSRGSLSELGDVVCRVYGGQVLVAQIADDAVRIANAFVRGPYGPVRDVNNASDHEVILKDWSNLQSRHVYNIISFGRP